MDKKLQALAERFENLTSSLSNPAILANQVEFLKATRKRAELEPIINAYEELKKAEQALEDAWNWQKQQKKSVL